MKAICRLCGHNKDDVIYIFGTEGLQHFISLKIKVRLDIEISAEDPLPKYACVYCLGKLDEFWDFRDQCRRIQSRLQRLFLEQDTIPSNISCDQGEDSQASTTKVRPSDVQGFPSLTDSVSSDTVNSNGGRRIEAECTQNDTLSYTSACEELDQSFNSCSESYGGEGEDWGISLESTDCVNEAQQWGTLRDEACPSTSQNVPYYQSTEQDGTGSATCTTLEKRACTATEALNNPLRVQDIPLQCYECPLMNALIDSYDKDLDNNSASIYSAPHNNNSKHSLLIENQPLQSLNTVTETTSRFGQKETVNNCSPLSWLMKEQSLEAQSTITQRSASMYLVKGSSDPLGIDFDSINNNSQHSLLTEKLHGKAPHTNRNIALIEEELGIGGAYVVSHNNSHYPIGIEGLQLGTSGTVADSFTALASVVEETDVCSVNKTSQHLLRKGSKTTINSTENMSKNTTFDFNVGLSSGNSQSVSVNQFYLGATANVEQNMNVSGRINVPGGISGVSQSVHNQNQNNVSLCQNYSNMQNTNSGFVNIHNRNYSSNTVNAVCVHGIDASVCYYKLCCPGKHPYDIYWKHGKSGMRCTLCEYGSPYQFCMRRHIHLHMTKKMFACSICNKKFTSYRYLKPHMEIHNETHQEQSSTINVNYNCDKCTKTFVSKATLHFHQMHYCGINSGCCPDCGQSFMA